jgi:hypothetical protein
MRDDTPAAEFWEVTLIVSNRNAQSMQKDESNCTIEKSKSVKKAQMMQLEIAIPAYALSVADRSVAKAFAGTAFAVDVAVQPKEHKAPNRESIPCTIAAMINYEV